MRHETFTNPDAIEFKVVPAPKKGEHGPNLSNDTDRMAHTLTGIFNEMAAEGWEFLRAERLPNDVGYDMTGTAAKEVTVLVFRRESCQPVMFRRASATAGPRPVAEPEPALRPVAEPLVLTNPLEIVRD
ncbi:hypothetical protein [Jannaschia aquimarina]|uniref:DUF4177 domain-containing protein n=1 Tax=Jannaschia aquimarina TaxID=935700 RepID=A0A0D1DCN5_9RHOB|nr:hypothetical protein [Jannaschia aquimarina]KIT17743.1 hypothetical protein jaqu_04660 [Jannaschia aquimarina]SNS96487.1 hypothetical protein SAMN05421775_10439 [Jannaschia aquimarina]